MTEMPAAPRGCWGEHIIIIIIIIFVLVHFFLVNGTLLLI